MKNVDTDKLVKSIQILIREELKSVLPKLVKEVVNSEVKKKTRLIEQKLRKEIKNQSNRQIVNESEESDEIEDPFEKAEKLLEQDRQSQTAEQSKPQFTSNQTINEILAETAKTYTPGGLNKGAQPPSYGNMPMYSEPEVEESTMNFDSSDVHTVAANTGKLDKASLAAKMGYGDMSGNNITTVGHTGKPVNPNDEKVAPVMKAMNRDYSELVKRFKK